MKSTILIIALALASILAVPPVSRLCSADLPDIPDIPDAQAEIQTQATAPLLAAAAPDVPVTPTVAPAAAGVEFAVLIYPAAPADGEPALMIAAEQTRIQRYQHHDPGRPIRWRSGTMKRPAGAHLASLRTPRGSGAGGLAWC